MLNRSLNAKVSLFPNIETLGYYDPFRHFILCNSVSLHDISQIDFSDVSFEEIEKIATIFHEIRHWCDHLGTFSGIQYLKKQFLAIEAKISNNVNDLYRIREYFKYVEKHSLQKYYTTQENDYSYDGKDSRWNWSLTSGHGFDDNGFPNERSPKFFIRFNDIEGNSILRFPITQSSLWELNAKNVEYNVLANFIGSCEDYQDWFMELLNRNIYHPELVLYSGSVHLFANIFGLSDVMEAYEMASMISTFTLNLPDFIIESIPYPDQLKEVWKDRTDNFRLCHDKGFTFYSLLSLFHDNGFNPANKEDYDKLFKKLSLPSMIDIKYIIDNEYKKIPEFYHDSEIDKRLRKLMEIGNKIWKLIGLWGNNVSMLDIWNQEDISPLIIFNDTKVVPREFAEWCDFSENIYKRLEEFNDICGI